MIPEEAIVAIKRFFTSPESMISAASRFAPGHRSSAGRMYRGTYSRPAVKVPASA
jgi:hypothetical protein